MKLSSNDFDHDQPIPAECAFGKSGSAGDRCVWAGNCNPHLAWSDVPAGTKSFALLCIDADAPSSAVDANQPGKRLPASLPRVEFVHWVMIDIPRECGELAHGSCSDGVVAHGKHSPIGPPGSRQGGNDYSKWFADDATMRGDYCGYDGPCPPWNDEIAHRYHFMLFALDVATLDVELPFTAFDVRKVLRGHVLGEAELVGTYRIGSDAA